MTEINSYVYRQFFDKGATQWRGGRNSPSTTVKLHIPCKRVI